MVRNVNNTEKIFAQRMEKHQDELRWLYMELYGNDAMYAELCEQMHDYYLKRSTELKKRDIKKEKNPDWFKEKEMLGMMLYIDNFAGNLKGVEKKLAYLKECNVNCLHLMPFLDTPKGKSDGGYAVADFRKAESTTMLTASRSATLRRARITSKTSAEKASSTTVSTKAPDTTFHGSTMASIFSTPSRRTPKASMTSKSAKSLANSPHPTAASGFPFPMRSGFTIICQSARKSSSTTNNHRRLEKVPVIA